MADFTIIEEIKDFDLKDYQEFINFPKSNKPYKIYFNEVQFIYYLHDLRSNRLHKFTTKEKITDEDIVLEFIEKFDSVRHINSY